MNRSGPFLWRLRPYFRGVGGLLIIGSINGLIMNTAVVLPAIALGNAINVALAVGRHQATSSDVAWAAALFLGATAATELPRIPKRWWLNGVAVNRFRANLQADMLRGVLGWPIERLTRTSVGDVMNKIVGDVDVLVVGVRYLIVETWDTVVFSLSLVIVMFAYSASLAAFALAPVLAALILAGVTGRRVAERTTRAREAASNLSTALHEHLSGVRVLRLFGRSGAAEGLVRSFADTQAGAELAKIRLEQALSAVYMIVITSGVVVIIAQGGAQVVTGQMTLGAFVAFLQLFARFLMKAPQIPQMANRVQAAGAAYTRIEPLLAARPPTAGDPTWASFRFRHLAGLNQTLPTPSAPQPGAATVHIDRITFCYPGASAPAITDISFEIPAGALVAVTGPVGAGKTALARALTGVWPLAGGSILIDGRALSELDSAERSVRIGYMAQNPHLFSGSIAENLLLSAEPIRRGGDDARLVAAGHLASLDKDLEEMAYGFDTQIGELGNRVSGGQRQRIGLARALIAAGRTPGFLILDDPFSAVDLETEAYIIAGLRAALGPKAASGNRSTILLCSHRVAAFTHADLIIVLDGGRIRESGTHAELMKAGDLYSRIYRAQSRFSGPSHPASGQN
jgi:ATP-binding cassette, subfamily B, multidrug efflux pump